jgi:hypothetical protein
MTCRKEPIDHPPEWLAGRQYGAVINIFPLCQNDSSTALAFDGSSGCAPWKGGAFLWVQVPPGTAPAGSNRSSHGGNEVAEASG